jgi:serine/threonine-protein kinase RsbW
MPEESQQPVDFTLRADRDGERLLIATTGELDLTTTPELEAALTDSAPYGALELDLEGLTFIDSSGLRLLLAERDRARQAGHGFRIVNASGVVARVFAISGFEPDLTPRLPGYGAAAEQPQAASTITQTREFSGLYPADPPSVSRIRHELVDYAREHGVRDEVVSAVGLAVSEATTNAVVHAYADQDEPGTLAIEAGFEDDLLWVTVSDTGRGMKPRPDSPGLGLGLPLISQMTQSFEVHQPPGGGTLLCMRFDAQRGQL